jgi:hypothetical protein
MKQPFFAALGLAAGVLVAPAQAQYAPYPYPPASAQPAPVSPAQVYPPSWSYDPYTSGQAPCPQGIPNEMRKCQDRMPPTYGQPSFWPQR